MKTNAGMVFGPSGCTLALEVPSLKITTKLNLNEASIAIQKFLQIHGF